MESTQPTVKLLDAKYGATGIVYKILLETCGGVVAVKVPRPDGRDDHDNEQRVYKILKNSGPYFVQYILLTPNFTILTHLPGGSLDELLHQYQTSKKRDCGGRRVLNVRVKYHVEVNKQRRLNWLWQMCSALETLWELGLAHGDIRPGNILLGPTDDIKLCDFGRCVKFGQALSGASEPFGRMHGPDEGETSGGYGNASRSSDHFGYGSMVYTLQHGHEPYEMEDWGEHYHIILCTKFHEKKFPTLGDKEIDQLTEDCWMGRITSLSARVKQLFEMDERSFYMVNEAQLETYRNSCQMMVDNGDLEHLVQSVSVHPAGIGGAQQI